MEQTISKEGLLGLSILLISRGMSETEPLKIFLFVGLGILCIIIRTILKGKGYSVRRSRKK